MQSLPKDVYVHIYRYIYQDCLQYMLTRLTIRAFYLDVEFSVRENEIIKKSYPKRCNACGKWILYVNNRYVLSSHMCTR